MLILQSMINPAPILPQAPTITLDGTPTLAAPGAALTGPALVFTTTRPRLHLEIDGLYSREDVQLALSIHLAATITDPLRFYLDFVRTPADYSEEQLAAELSRLIATALRPPVAELTLAELNSDPNLRAWLETAIRTGLQEIDLAGRSGLQVEALEAYDLRCAVWDERQQAATARYLRHALAAAASDKAATMDDRPLVDERVLAAVRGHAAAASPPPTPDERPRPQTLQSMLRNPPSLLRPEVWRHSLQAKVTTQPVCSAQQVFIATNTGAVHAFDLADGTAAWPQPAQIGAAPGDGMTLAGDLLWVPAHDGVLYALRAASGMIVQRVAIGGRLSSAPLAVGDRLYVSVDVSRERSDDKAAGQIVAIHAQSGHTLGAWQVSSHGLRGQPVAHAASLYVGDRQGAFFHLDVARNRVEPLPQVRIGRILGAAAVDARRSQVIVGGTFGVMAVDFTGRVRWTARTGGSVGGVVAQPLVRDDTVFVGAADGQVHMLRAGDGQPAHPPFATGGPIATAPVAIRHLVVVGSNDGSLYALEAETGKLFWSYRSGAAVVITPAVAPEGAHAGLLIAVDSAGNVNALRWCLARFAEAARLAQASDPPRLAEAIDLWLLAQDVEMALDVAERAQRWDVIAQLATDLQLHEKAASAWERLAAVARPAERCAADWQAAADQWLLAGNAARAQTCLLKAADARQAPLLTLRVVNHPEFVHGRGETVQIAVVNLTERLAQRAVLRCGGHVTLHQSAEFAVAGHQEHRIDIPVTPTRSGSATLNLHLTYADSRSHAQPPVAMAVRLSVAQPPVVQNHFYGPTITGEGVIIMRGEGGRVVQVGDGDSIVQIGSAKSGTRRCPHCEQITMLGPHCDQCGGVLG